MIREKVAAWFGEFAKHKVPEVDLKDVNESAQKVVIYAMWKQAPDKEKLKACIFELIPRLEIIVQVKHG